MPKEQKNVGFQFSMPPAFVQEVKEFAAANSSDCSKIVVAALKSFMKGEDSKKDELELQSLQKRIDELNRTIDIQNTLLNALQKQVELMNVDKNQE